MGEKSSTKWIIITIAYFVLMLIVVTGADSLANHLQVGSNFTYQSAIFTTKYSYDTFECGLPRFEYERGTNGVVQTDNDLGAIEVSCDATRGAYGETICNSISGCNWENITTGFWWWTETSDVQNCEGFINRTYYNNGTIPSAFTDVCDMPLTNCDDIECKINCNNLGCSIFDYRSQDLDYSVSGIYQSLKDLASFRLDFQTDNALLSLIISILTFYLPLTLLLLQLRFLSPI